MIQGTDEKRKKPPKPTLGFHFNKVEICRQEIIFEKFSLGEAVQIKSTYF